MKRFKNVILIILTGMLAYGCYEPLEIDTENIGKVEVPVKFAAPLMDGSFILEFDSFFNVEDVGDNLISYEDGKAFFKYDTVLNFYDELSEFLTMSDVDFGNMTSFEEEFNLALDLPDIEINYQENLSFLGGAVVVPVDTTIKISPQDTFKTKYGNNSIFIVPADSVDYQLEVLNYGDPIELSLPYEVYRVDVASGLINLYINHSHLLPISDTHMSMTPSLRFQYTNIFPPLTIDTIFSEALSIPIYKDIPTLPEGIQLRATIEIASLKSVATDQIFDKEYVVNTLDTSFVLDLSEYYYYSADGGGLIELDVAAYLEIESPKDTAVVPLPDTLYFGTTIDNLVFEHVVFNYGKDTAMTGSQEIEFDVFSSLPEDLDIDGFRLSNPELKLKVQSNLGFSALFDIDSLLFTTNGDPEFITEDGTASLEVPFPTDPRSAVTYIPAGVDSIYLDSATSRLEEVELLNVNGLLVSYNVVINPDDEAGIPGKHNYFYDYSDDIVDDMYDVKLSAEVRIPFEFKFDNISFQETMESPLAADGLDSMFYFGDTDSVSLKVMMLTKDFPFKANAQFYFDELNSSGGLNHLDSMFNESKTLLPSSSDGQWDSVSWSLTIDQSKYESMKVADSLTFEIRLSMDEDDFFQLEEGYSTEIGYKFSIDKSSFVITQE